MKLIKVCIIYQDFLNRLTGTVERISKWGGRGGGAENERWRREFVGGSGGIPPENLKSRGSEIVFTAFSARYFLK